MKKYSNNFWVHLFGKTDHKIITIEQLFQMHHEGCTYCFILNFTHFYYIHLMVPQAFPKTWKNI